MAQSGNRAQHTLVGLVGEGDRAPALPTIAAQAVEAAVVAGTRIGVGGDESGGLSTLVLV